MGVDSYANTINTTLTIVVLPNVECEAKYSDLNTTCTEGVFCSFTIVDDYFEEPNDEELTYSLDSVTEN